MVGELLSGWGGRRVFSQISFFSWNVNGGAVTVVSPSEVSIGFMLLSGPERREMAERRGARSQLGSSSLGVVSPHNMAVLKQA